MALTETSCRGDVNVMSLHLRINPAASDARLAPAAADWAPSGRGDPAWAAPGGRHWAAAECDEAAAADGAGRAHARGEAVRPRWAVHDDRRRGRRPADSTGRHRGDARWHVTETYTNSPRLQYTSQSCGIFLVSISYCFCYHFFFLISVSILGSDKGTDVCERL